MDDNSKKSIAHFLDNKNYPAAKKAQKKKKAEKHAVEEQKDELIIVNGQIVINKAQKTEREIVVEDRVTSFSYGKPYMNRSRWTKEQTALFYRALSLCGTDFTMLEKIFTDKERKQIKNKYTKEEKEHPEKINSAMKTKLPFTKQELDALREEYINTK